MTRSRRTKLWAFLLASAGVALVLAGIVWAIFEGYASDAELRPAGSIVPAVLSGVAGVICLLVGVTLGIRSTRKPRRSPQ